MSDEASETQSRNRNRFSGVAIFGLCVLAFSVFVLLMSYLAAPLGWILGDVSVILGPATYTISCPQQTSADLLHGAVNFDQKRDDFVKFLVTGHCPFDGLPGGKQSTDNGQFGNYNDVYAGIQPFWGDDIVGHAFQKFGESLSRGYQDQVIYFGPYFITYIAASGGFRLLYWVLLVVTGIIFTAFFANFGTTMSKKFLGVVD